LSTIIGAYKSIVTKRINQIQGTPGNVVWQRNFFDWIIRDEKMLNNVINYIMTNPERWDADTDNLDNASNDQ
jgi:REP element-mobilizing transposase RayT